MTEPKPRVLIVDDSYTARRLLTSQLKVLGYATIVEAENGEQALLMLREAIDSKRPIGLIITDLRMPKMEGSEFLQRLSEAPEFKKVPKLISSVETDEGTVLSSVMKGADGYILKPTTVEVLKAKIEKAFGKTRAAS